MAPPKDKWVRRFVISETSRHKKGFTIYKVTSVMFIKTSPDVVSKVSIWKRYSDFKKLHNTLKSLHSVQQIKEPFPSFPKPKFFGRFEADVIEERRECALKLLEFIGRHQALYSSEAFVKFFETDNADKNFLESSQSLSSDTSEEDKIATENGENGENGFTDTKDLPKFVCTRKVTPVIVGKESNTKSKHKNLYGDSHVNSNNNSSKTNNNDVVDGQEALQYNEGAQDQNQSSVVVIHDGSDLSQSFGESDQYILIAAAHMSAAFRHEAIAEYEEAFTQYKLGISHLINGVQYEVDVERQTAIQEKITKYLQRAERLYNRHLNCNVSVLHKPVTELRNYKVIELMGSVMLVRDTLQGFQRIIKTVEKIADSKEEISSYILRGKVPYMVQLYSCMQTDSTVFLILQYMSKGKLWNFIKSNYKLDHRKNSFAKRGHSRSFSCDAVIQLNSGEESENNLPEITPEEIPSEDNCSSPMKNDTSELVKNAQKLLQSVNATLKRSNSIAIRLNESGRLLYKQKELEDDTSDTGSELKNDSIEDYEDTENSGDLGELSRSISFTNLIGDQNKLKETRNVCQEKSKSKKDEDLSNNLSSSSINITQTMKINGKIDHEQINEDQSQFKKLDNCPAEFERQIWSIPESVVKKWAAQILLAIEALHQQNVIISDLRPDNILIDDYGNASMTYIVPRKDTELLRLKKPYSSPELCMFIPPISITTSADVWSYGVLLYELLTGFDFQVKHPGQFHSHSLVNIPDDLSSEAKSLLLNILRYQPSDRLTIPEIKQQPFFAKADWLGLLNAQV